MQTSACNAVAHVTSELAVNSTAVNITAACPVTEGIYHSRREHLTEIFCICVALADNKTVTVKDDTSHAVAVLGTATLDHDALTLGPNSSVVVKL